MFRASTLVGLRRMREHHPDAPAACLPDRRSRGAGGAWPRSRSTLSAFGRGEQSSLGGLVAVPFLAAILAPAAVGLFVALRRPEQPVAWILLSARCRWRRHGCRRAANLTLYDDRDSTAGAWAALVGFQWPVLFLWPLALAYLFPDGRLPSPPLAPVRRGCRASRAAGCW